MSCELGIKKPDSEIFRKCLNDLRVSAKECIYVGDGGSFELEASEKLGMNPVQAVWYLKDNVGQPEKVKEGYIHAMKPLDIPKILVEYNAQK